MGESAEFLDQGDVCFEGFPGCDGPEDTELVDAGEEKRRFGLRGILHPENAGGLGGALDKEHGRHERASGKMVGEKRQVGVEGFPTRAAGGVMFLEAVDEPEARSVRGEGCVHGRRKVAAGKTWLRRIAEKSNRMTVPRGKVRLMERSCMVSASIVFSIRSGWKLPGVEGTRTTR